MKMNNYQRRWHNPTRRWIYEHREVVENEIDRKLTSAEHVHHIDENPKNNDIKNLKIVSASDHIRIHKPSSIKSQKAKVCSVKDCNNKNHALKMCNKHYMRYLRSKNNKNSK